jgi:KipI family sensor histidine kinase inhibitor
VLRGLYLPFADTVDRERNRALHALTRALLKAPLAGVTDIVPGYTNLYIEYDSAQLNPTDVRRWLTQAAAAANSTATGRQIDIPVSYTGEDLAEVARRCQLTVDAVIAKHSQRTYHVYALGFTPGFPFMGEVDEALRLPRRTTPRPRVPAHSVAIAGSQTGIYPTASPGGWHLLGHTSVTLFDPHRTAPFWLEAGDSVRFVPSDPARPAEPQPLALLPAEPNHPLLEVITPGLCDLIVDAGRFLVGRFGLARSGPIDAHAAGLANRLLGNPPGAAVLELNLSGPTFRVLGAGVIAFAGWGVAPWINQTKHPPFRSLALRSGDTLSFKPIATGYRGYLALPGGIESRHFWGSAAVDLRGKIGRALQASDVLGSVRPPAHPPRAGFSFTPYRRFCGVTTLVVMPGPQATPAALSALSSTVFTVSSADRMGIRLSGAKIPGGDVTSEATPLGAVQITTDGEPIILLNDRGTLGGYSKPALLEPSALLRAAQLRPGDRVRFISAPG